MVFLEKPENLAENSDSPSGMVIVKWMARAPARAAREPDRKCGETNDQRQTNQSDERLAMADSPRHVAVAGRRHHRERQCESADDREVAHHNGPEHTCQILPRSYEGR